MKVITLGVTAMIALTLPSMSFAQAFDLACSVNKSRMTKKGEVPDGAATIRLRVDLAERVWCFDACDKPEPIL